jgi:hypothetical protein
MKKAALLMKKATTLRRQKISSTSATLSRCCSSADEWTRQSSMYTNAPSGPDAPGRPPLTAEEGARRSDNCWPVQV